MGTTRLSIITPEFFEAMVMRPLILTDTERATIKRVMAHASSHRLTVANLQRIIAGTDAPPGRNKYHTCVIPVGYYCVYTEEEQPKLGTCRHLSVAVMGEGVAPNEIAVEMLMAEFGFRDGMSKLDGVWIDNLAKEKVAINVVQRLVETTTENHGTNTV